jgi:Spy/CpxP family protein refolding chaperone
MDKNAIGAFALGIILTAAIIQLAPMLTDLHDSHENGEHESEIESPYAGEESRGIKSLSEDDINGLLAGAGTPFGGMAKPAELNGYPGPRHVLDAVEAEQFNLTDEQQKFVEDLYQSMLNQSIPLGEQIIAVEKEMDDAFSNGTITSENLSSWVNQSVSLYGQLRIVHLETHLTMVEILTPEQVEQYNELRGYTSDDPCNNVPDGHDEQMWREHNNCD